MTRNTLFVVLALSCGNDELVALKAERDGLKAQLSAVTVHAETWLAFVSVVEAITNTDAVSYRTYSRKLYDMKLDDRVYGVLNTTMGCLSDKLAQETARDKARLREGDGEIGKEDEGDGG